MPPEFKQDPKRLSVWKMLFGALHKRRTLTRADSAAAVLLVEHWVLWEVVNAEAQAHPFSEVTWRDSVGHEHTKTVESAALKSAATLQRGIMQALKEFSATPASREKTKKTKEPALKPGKVQTTRRTSRERTLQASVRR
ncbi:MAG: P27 family phage terminase small subunit [Candidatus Sulfotelmatobacter sp.]